MQLLKCKLMVVDGRWRDLLHSQPVPNMRLPPDASQMVAQVIKASAHAGDERKIFMLTLRGMHALFGFRAGAIFAYRRSDAELEKVKAIGDATWDPAALMSFYRNLKPALPPEVIMAPVRRGYEVIGVMALQGDKAFDAGAGKIATEALKIVGGHLGERRQAAILEAEAAIARSLITGVRPPDVIYRIFHQLRRFIAYDHSATLWWRAGEGEGRVVARQVAWTKGRSSLVGTTGALPWGDLAGLEGPAIVGPPILDALPSVTEPAEPPQRSALLSLLASGERPLGCIVLASGRPDFFLDSDARLLSRFEVYLTHCLEQTHPTPGGSRE